MSSMTHQELRHVMKNIQDCDDYLQGKSSTENVRALAEHAAKRAVMERKVNLIERLRGAGLNIVDDEA